MLSFLQPRRILVFPKAEAHFWHMVSLWFQQVTPGPSPLISSLAPDFMGVGSYSSPAAGLGISLHSHEEHWCISPTCDGLCEQQHTHLVYHTSQICVACKLAESALCASMQDINEELTQPWAHYQSLRRSRVTILQWDPVLPATTPQAWKFSQFSVHLTEHLLTFSSWFHRWEYHGRWYAKWDQNKQNHSTPLVHWASNFISESHQVDQASFPFYKTSLIDPNHFVPHEFENRFQD